MTRIFAITCISVLFSLFESKACSMFYYIDKTTGKIYFVNNEDYWYDEKPYIQIYPKSKNEFARLWYGWNDFAQGGINEYGLLFDGAVTPKQEIPDGFSNPNGRNVGDEILAKCKSVDEAIDYLEKEKIAISEGHIMFGDGSGNAAVLEWINGERKITHKKDNMLISTNYLLSDTTAGNYPCYRYQSIEEKLIQLNENKEDLNLKIIGNAIAGAAQAPQKYENGKMGGTLYSSFINVSDMGFVLVYKLNNSKITILDLKEEFAETRKTKIKLDDL